MMMEWFSKKMRLSALFTFVGAFGVHLLMSSSGAWAQAEPVRPLFDDTLEQRAATALERLNLLSRDGPPDECALGLGEPERQVLRVHTEMMLTALACRDTYRRANLVPIYDNFIFRNQETIIAAQERVDRDLRRDGADFRALDDLLTILANREAVELAGRGTSTYCRMRQSRWDFTMTSSIDEFQTYTEQLALRTANGCQVRR